MLDEKLVDIYGSPGDYSAGANISGFIRVADAMPALGVVSGGDAIGSWASRGLVR